MAKVQNAFTNQGTLTGLAGGLGEQLIDSALGAMSPLNNFGRYMTGSRAIIKVNGKLFGFAFGVTYNIQTMAEEINTIDDWTPWELAPTRISINGTLSMFHIPGKGPTRELVQANVLSFLFHKYITLEISDQTTGQLIFKTERAMITGKSQTLTAGEISTIELQWKAIGWIDELTPFYPNGHDGEDSSAGGGGLVSAIGNLFG
jgi:hypothetical protein